MTPDPAEPTSAFDKTNVSMAPEQGLSSKTNSEKPISNASGHGGSQINLNNLHPDDTPYENISSSLIYRLRKEQLLLASQKFHLDPSGRTVHELRRLLCDAIKKRKTSTSTENLLQCWQEEIQREESDILHPLPTASLAQQQPVFPKSSGNNLYTQSLSDNSHNNDPIQYSNPPIKTYSNNGNYSSNNNNNISTIPQETALAKLVKHWDISYSGGTDLYVFLNRIETRMKAVNLHPDQLVHAIPYFLKDSALRWHEVHGNDIQSWGDFSTKIANFFLPRRYLAQLESNFYSRKQQNREKGRDYILDMLTIIQQHPVLRQHDHLDRIYDGLNIDYRLHLNRDRIKSIDDLTTRINEYEQLRAEESKVNRHTSHVLTLKYNRPTDCWNCKQQGHKRNKCKNKQQLFCSYCGTDNVLTRNCLCRNPTKLLSTPKHKARYMLDIKIRNNELQALLDTGASLSYTDERMVPILKTAGFKPIKSNHKIQLANKELIVSKFTVRVPITYKNRETWHNLIALPNLSETIILGMDFLHSRDLRLKLDGELITKPVPNLPDYQPLHTHSRKDVILAVNDLQSLDWVAKKITEVKNNLNKNSDFQVINNRLYKYIRRRSRDKSVNEWKLCMTEQDKPRILSNIHSNTAAGHMGIAKTLRRAQEQYYWPGMHRDVVNHVKSCLDCAHLKPEKKKPADLLTTMQDSKPWHIMYADFIGPLSRTSKGHTNLLVISDKISRWVDLIPVSQASSDCLVAALKDHIKNRFGCPKILITAKGNQFTSRKVTKFLKTYGIEQKFTTSYALHANPIEETKKTIKTMITQHCQTNCRQWDTILSNIALTFNTAGQKSAKLGAMNRQYPIPHTPLAKKKRNRKQAKIDQEFLNKLEIKHNTKSRRGYKYVLWKNGVPITVTILSDTTAEVRHNDLSARVSFKTLNLKKKKNRTTEPSGIQPPTVKLTNP